MRDPGKRLVPRVILLLAASCTARCQRLADYKAQWHAQPAVKRTGSLTVEVEPHEGISVWLDANRIGQASPVSRDELAAGRHLLEVRAMGYYPVSLPIDIDPNHPLRLPVRLRGRAPLPFVPLGPLPRPAPSAATDGDEPTAAPRSLPLAGDAVRRPPLPGRTAPLRLSVLARPAAAIVIDGVAADADDVRLLYGEGQLKVGELSLGYHVRAGRQLEFVIPQERAGRGLWYVNGTQVKAHSLVRLSAVPVAFRRLASGRRAEAVLRRID